MTLSMFGEYHSEAMAGKLRGSTLREYDHAIAHVKAALAGDPLLDAIGPAEIGRIEKHLRDLDRSSATIHMTLSQLRALLARAVKWQLLARNPLTGWEMPGIKAKDARLFTRDELDAIVAKAPSTWWAAFVRLAADSGLRKDELLQLRWSDVDPDAPSIAVRKREPGAATVGGVEYPVLGREPKAKASLRSVPVTKATATTLRRLQTDVRRLAISVPVA